MSHLKVALGPEEVAELGPGRVECGSDGAKNSENDAAREDLVGEQDSADEAK